ncbi:hypothetical protein KQ944_12565 [Bacillus subtilis]|uniref:hypothetical protein n=1 Tax=Pseudochrobactrum asaccharolyticum TaxID=354351 RepID=UPI001F3B3475|nr:hypothetical protein [Pseudochrobactrum asaccharolyticum]MCF7645999.1 hypothetical protein [Pseudochrobactrum asaccharolyticum]MCF7672466.1 hypothetical protein [Bacillus subtilis]
MLTMLERKEIATGRKDQARGSASLVEQKKVLENATRKTAGLASRAFSKTLLKELEKLKA